VINPYRRIRELESQLAVTAEARVRAEDDNRLLRAQLTAAREESTEAWKALNAKSEKIEDWMAALMRQPPIHSSTPFDPKPAPPPTPRPMNHGAQLEARAEEEMLRQLERDLGIHGGNPN
jgi:hypothetical protein